MLRPELAAEVTTRSPLLEVSGLLMIHELVDDDEGRDVGEI